MFKTAEVVDDSLPIYTGEEARKILASYTPLKWTYSAAIDEVWGGVPLSVQYEKQRKREAAKRARNN